VSNRTGALLGYLAGAVARWPSWFCHAHWPNACRRSRAISWGALSWPGPCSWRRLPRPGAHWVLFRGRSN